MTSAQTRAHLGSGSSLVVGTVGDEGRPHASRAWGARFGDDDRTVRILLDTADTQTIENLRQRPVVAVTGADVRTLESTQVKGVATDIDAANRTDESYAHRHREEFYRAIEEVDGTPLLLLDRLTPSSLIAVTVEVRASFDQTPGPGAGTELAPEDA